VPMWSLRQTNLKKGDFTGRRCLPMNSPWVFYLWMVLLKSREALSANRNGLEQKVAKTLRHGYLAIEKK